MHALPPVSWLHRGALGVATVLLLIGSVQAQTVNVQASVNATTVGSDETVTFELEVQGAPFSDIEMPEPPETEGLVLQQAIPSTQRNIQFFNGKMQQSIAFTWTYRPVREGAAQFRPLEVTVAGERYVTEAIQLTIVPQSQRPQRRRAPFAQRRSQTNRPDPAGQPPAEEAPSAPTIDAEDLFIQATPSARRVYQGEQVTIDYRLFFREGIQLRQSRLADAGDADGFWREELEVDPRPIPQTVVENGLRYNMITLKRVAVFPARSGRLEIEPLRIQTEAYVPLRSSDPFERFFSLRSQFEPVELASPPVVIEARPLPTPPPDGFVGTVGRYQMRVRVDATEVEVGEPVEVEIRLTGTGNLATLEAPALNLPGVFEQYDPQVTTTISRNGRRVAGAKTFAYVLVPRSNGTFELPSIAYPYFDPAGERYEQLQAPAQQIRVTGTASVPLAASTTATGLPVDDIAPPLLAATRWVSTGSSPVHTRPWVYALILLPLAAVGGLAAVRRRRDALAADVAQARSRQAHPLARKQLKQAEVFLQQDQPYAFYDEVARAVLGFVGNRLNVAERGLSRARLGDALTQAGVSADTWTHLTTLLDECDQARFSPVVPNQATMASARDRAGQLIVAIDQALRTPSSVASS
ncbi:MAG: BatD family protein [Bacteroidota bacterium]